jgi:Winged helix DNA-binding domain
VTVSVAADRFAAQLLTDPSARTPEEVVERLLAVQAQDPRGARLAIRSRSYGLHGSDVDRALDDRSLVITTLNRGTLHLVRPEDYWWLQQLTTPQLLTGSSRRLMQEGVPPADADRAVAIIEKTLMDGPATRTQLRDRIADAGIRVEGQAFMHQIYRASLEGLIVRGPMVGNEHGFVLVRDWLGPAPTLDRDTSLSELGRRYLAGHGPADAQDLARWTGLTLSDARRALTGAGIERADGLLGGRGSKPAERLPAPRLLGSFEPVLLGWTSRDAIIGEGTTLVTSNGIFRPFALVDGVAVGSWTFPGGKVTLTPFRTLSARVTEALAADAIDVQTYLTPRKA